MVVNHSPPTSGIFFRYEIPRKLVHLLVGSLILQAYTHGISPPQIATWNLHALLFFTGVDMLRHHSPAFNAGHHSIFGCLMRPKESARYNSLVWYLLGTYLALVLFPTDVGLVGVLILCYSDPAAAMVGRGFAGHSRYLRTGKSVVGTLAAGVVGGVIGVVFWGDTSAEASFMFTGRLEVCSGWGVSGNWAVGILGVVSGLVAAGSEFVDVWGCDDNLVIPMMSSLGLWGFLCVFGGGVRWRESLRI
ncbi:hypothetical protein FE257_010686 [Aspergillus nanangensis]|uniref:Uncharacterized protein n=1 Tax=Aspergillus nanangensis TaxID=2582783 RepID=A0AAD4GRV4_ASPNN|nr:hypothetical protein FE257_010686 [Aspergillus nanangensis]